MLIGVTQLLAEFLTGKRTNKIQVLTLDEDLKNYYYAYIFYS